MIDPISAFVFILGFGLGQPVGHMIGQQPPQVRPVKVVKTPKPVGFVHAHRRYRLGDVKPTR